MESLKTWLIQVGIKTAGPSGIRAMIQAIVAFFIVHGNALAQWGVTTTGHVTTIDWDKAGVVLIGLLPMLAMAIKTGQFHAGAFLTGAPQSGADMASMPQTVDKSKESA